MCGSKFAHTVCCYTFSKIKGREKLEKQLAKLSNSLKVVELILNSYYKQQKKDNKKKENERKLFQNAVANLDNLFSQKKRDLTLTTSAQEKTEAVFPSFLKNNN